MASQSCSWGGSIHIPPALEWSRFPWVFPRHRGGLLLYWLNVRRKVCACVCPCELSRGLMRSTTKWCKAAARQPWLWPRPSHGFSGLDTFSVESIKGMPWPHSHSWHMTTRSPQSSLLYNPSHCQKGSAKMLTCNFYTQGGFSCMLGSRVGLCPSSEMRPMNKSLKMRRVRNHEHAPWGQWGDGSQSRWGWAQPTSLLHSAVDGPHFLNPSLLLRECLAWTNGENLSDVVCDRVTSSYELLLLLPLKLSCVPRVRGHWCHGEPSGLIQCMGLAVNEGMELQDSYHLITVLVNHVLFTACHCMRTYQMQWDEPFKFTC